MPHFRILFLLPYLVRFAGAGFHDLPDSLVYMGFSQIVSANFTELVFPLSRLMHSKRQCAAANSALVNNVENLG